MAQVSQVGDRVRHVVLGASGFIGANLVKRLVAVGAEVIAVDQAAADLDSLGASQTLHGNIGDRSVMTGLLETGDVVHVLAGGSLPDDRGADPRTQLDETVGATLALLEACVDAKVARVMFPSSGGTVYGVPERTPIGEDHPTNPISAYGVQKLAIEKYLFVYARQRGLDAVVMRIGNPYGPGQDPARGQGLVAAVIARVLRGDTIQIWGGGEVVRDYLFIDDLTKAMVTLAAYKGTQRLFNVGSGVGLSVNQIVAAAGDALPDRTITIERRPARNFDVPVNILDISRLTGETSWVPLMNLADGMKRTAAWIQGRM